MNNHVLPRQGKINMVRTIITGTTNVKIENQINIYLSI